VAGKFLVLWRLDIGRLSEAMARAVLRQQDHARRLVADGKLIHRYHLVGGHGGAWIYEVESNEELDRLLAASPVYNFANYEVFTLAEMDEVPVMGPTEPG
jgi:muconolactone delta-isomerase